MNPYASRIRKIRVSHGYSQEYMALKLGMTLSSYSKLERGLVELSVTRLVQISEVLEFDLGQFFQEEPVDSVSDQTQVGYGFVTRAEFLQHLDKMHLLERQLSDILSKLP